MSEAVKEAPAAGWRTLEIPELFPLAKIAMTHDRATRRNGVGGSSWFSEMKPETFWTAAARSR